MANCTFEVIDTLLEINFWARSGGHVFPRVWQILSKHEHPFPREVFYRLRQEFLQTDELAIRLPDGCCLSTSRMYNCWKVRIPVHLLPDVGVLICLRRKSVPSQLHGMILAYLHVSEVSLLRSLSSNRMMSGYASASSSSGSCRLSL